MPRKLEKKKKGGEEATRKKIKTLFLIHSSIFPGLQKGKKEVSRSFLLSPRKKKGKGWGEGGREGE